MLCVVLCCAVLCCVLLCCMVLCCAVFCCAVLCCVVFCCAVLCFAVLCCVLLCCAVLYGAVLCCMVLCCAVLCCVVFWYSDFPLTPPPNVVTACFHLLGSMEPEVKSSKKTTVVAVSKKRRDTGTTAFIVSPVIQTQLVFSRSIVKRSSACVCLPVLNCVLGDKDEHQSCQNC